MKLNTTQQRYQTDVNVMMFTRTELKQMFESLHLVHVGND